MVRNSTAPLLGRLLGLALALCATLTPVVAQQADSATPERLALADLDLSSSTIHQAGPAAFYVRNVTIEGDAYSLFLEQADGYSWSVTRVIPESANILPRETILDFATISIEDSTIRIDGVLVGDRVYGGALQVGGDDELELAEQIRRVPSSSINEARADALRELLVIDTDSEFETALAEQRAELQAVIDRVEAERDAFRLQVEELADENEELEAERDELLAEQERLESRLGDRPGIEGGGTPESGDLTTPLSGDEVQALIRERDQLAGDIVGLVMENNELRDERRDLRDQIDELQTRNTGLKDDVETMTSEVSRLQELVEAYQASLGEEPGAPRPTDDRSEAPADWTFPGDYVRSADLQAATQAVTNELRQIDDRLAALESAASNLADFEEALRSGVRSGLPLGPLGAEPAGELPGARDRSELPPGGTSPADDSVSGAEARAALADAERAEQLALLRAEVAELLAENEELRAEKQALEDRVLDEILSNGFVRIMKERLTEEVASGFGAGASDTGSWSVGDRSAVQTDPDAYFAKLVMPADQSSEPVLYSFRVRSLDADGWVGVGLHLFVEDVERRRGYGMGSSLLVWFTRDPAERRTTTTYLQLYRSDDDVNMARVLDAAIPEGMNDYLVVDVLYEPVSQYITVAVDGVDRIRYRTWFGIESGVELALRTLGRAEFRDFRVTTAP
ncbi:MAG: hypothetical protein ACOC2Y_08420 [Spirochaetota bacterium]